MTRGSLDSCAREFGTGLTPMQFAAQIGHHDMFKHIVSRSMTILWKWGPVTQNMINLKGIDSAPCKGGEVLELIGRFDAKISTQEMLLDDFMEGFLQGVVQEKWDAFAQYMWLVHRSLDFAYLMPLMANALWLKEDPETALGASYMPMLTMAMMMPSLLEDLRGIVMWLRTVGSPAELAPYCAAHGITLKLIGMTFTSVACLALIMGYKPAGVSGYLVQFPHGDGVGTEREQEWLDSHNYVLPPPPSPKPPPPFPPVLPGQVLQAMPSPVPVPNDTVLLPDTPMADDKFPLMVFLAVGLVVQMQYFFSNLVQPNQQMGILFIMVDKMFSGDVMKFMKVFSIVLVNYGVAQYIAYPRTGDVFQPLVSPSFNGMTSAVQALVEMAMLGENIKLDLSHFGSYATKTGKGMSVGQKLETVAYIGMLYLYIIMALVLLLNLLIALMGDTYVKVMEQAVREWRVANLQLILRLEILSKPFTSVYSGTPMGDNYFVLTRSHDTIDEGSASDDIDGDGAPGFSVLGMNPDAAATVLQRQYRAKLEARKKRRAKKNLKSLPPRPAEHDPDWDMGGEDFWDSSSGSADGSDGRRGASSKTGGNPFGPMKSDASGVDASGLPPAAKLPPPREGQKSAFAAGSKADAPTALPLAPASDRAVDGGGTQSARAPSAATPATRSARAKPSTARGTPRK